LRSLSHFQNGHTPLRAPGLTVVDAERNSVVPTAVVDEALHARVADLLRRYDLND
jgi:hypothetical protein